MNDKQNYIFLILFCSNNYADDNSDRCFIACVCISFLPQLTETLSESSYYSPQKVKSREVLCLEQQGITIEVRPYFCVLTLLTRLKKSTSNNIYEY